MALYINISNKDVSLKACMFLSRFFHVFRKVREVEIKLKRKSGNYLAKESVEGGGEVYQVKVLC